MGGKGMAKGARWEVGWRGWTFVVMLARRFLEPPKGPWDLVFWEGDWHRRHRASWRLGTGLVERDAPCVAEAQL